MDLKRFVQMAKGASFLFSLALVITLASSSVNAVLSSPGLVLWNKMETQNGAVLLSEVGEHGTIAGSSYAFEAAQHGNGYVRKATGANYVKFPASVLDNLHHRGAIELWINPKVPNPVPYRYGSYGLIGTPYGRFYGVPESGNINLRWGDTVSGVGLLGSVRFDTTHVVSTSPEPTPFVATPFVSFHAAICWDIDGIDGTTETVRVYRDNVVVGSTTGLWDPNGTEKWDIILGYGPDGQAYDKFITDNLKIWDYAKIDFSDRFEEGVNSPPTADANGPYIVPEGGSIQLDGSGSFDPDPGDTLTHEWDLDNDNVFGETGATAEHGDEIGVTPTFDGGGLDGPTFFPISLRVTDSYSLSHEDASTVNIENVAPTATFSNDGPVVEDTTATVSFSDQTDPSMADTAAGFHYAYDFDNDGTFEIGDGTYAGSVTDASATVPAQYLPDPVMVTVAARIIDKDDGYTFETTGIEVLVRDSDGDGLPDDDDAYPFSDMSETVCIGDCDSGVANQVLPDGATFMDLILTAADEAENHGDFVSGASQLANQWKKDKLISGRDKGKITSCAARSDIP